MSQEITVVYSEGYSVPIQFIEALDNLVKFFKDRGLTHQQIEKAFEFCLYTHGECND